MFYRNGTKGVVATSIEPEFAACTLQVYFKGPYGLVEGLSYDVERDGKCFLILFSRYNNSQERELHTVTNWFEELKQLILSGKER